MIWQEILTEIKQDSTISKRRLKLVPQLITCDNWFGVKPLGNIDYSVPLCSWKGYIAEYKDNVYYVPQEVYDKLRNELKWKVKFDIEVVE